MTTVTFTMHYDGANLCICTQIYAIYVHAYLCDLQSCSFINDVLSSIHTYVICNNGLFIYASSYMHIYVACNHGFSYTYVIYNYDILCLCSQLYAHVCDL